MTKNEMQVYGLMRRLQMNMDELGTYLLDCMIAVFDDRRDDGRYIRWYKTLKCMQEDQKHAIKPSC